MESSEEDFSDDDIADIFGESEGEDDFGILTLLFLTT